MKREQIREASLEVTVGAFMFLILLLLGVFTIILSRQNLFTRTYYTNVEFSEVLGVREGDNVYLRGVAVGKVDRVQVDGRRVRVTLAVDRELELHADYRIEILPTSVLGGRYLHIYEGSEDQPRLARGATVLGTTPVDLIDSATRTVQLVRKALEEGGVIENLKATMSNLSNVTARLNAGEGTLGKLLAADDTVYDDLKAAAANIREITADITAGRGTLGRLTKDDALYEDVSLLINETRATLDDVRETSPITTFTSIFFGAL